MGLVLDSSVLIATEREAKPVSDLLFDLEHKHGETEIVLSVITVMEIEHGLHRAQTAEQAHRRRDYRDTILAAIPVEPFTQEMAQIGARIDAEARKTGAVIPFCRSVDWSDGTSPWLYSRHKKSAPLSTDSRSQRDFSLAACGTFVWKRPPGPRKLQPQSVGRPRQGRQRSGQQAMIVVMSTVRITEAELAADVHAVLEKVRNGAEVIVEENHRPVAVIKASRPAGRLISEVLAELEARASTAVMDDEFARDIEEGIKARREPWNPPSWE
jgi:tRNA(fMet)-specific endonuclease VapC